MTETPTAPPKPKRRMTCVLEFSFTSGRGLGLEMPTRAALAEAYDKVLEAMVGGLGTIEIVTKDGRASVDTIAIVAVRSQVYWVFEHPDSLDF
jgi:hypothetical protein